jgi:hypothetical protein
MEIPNELKTDVERTLLGPLSLAVELYGALCPGLVFILLLAIKRHWTAAALSYPLLGYKTKIALILFAAYVIGKTFLGALGLVSWAAQKAHKWATNRKESQEAQQKGQTPTTQLSWLLSEAGKAWKKYPGVRSVVAGFLGGAILSNESQLMDHYTMAQASAAFYLNTGIVLIVSFFIHGDVQPYRVLELAAGIILYLRGVILSGEESKVIVRSSYGVALSNYLANLKPEQSAAVLKASIQILTKLAQTRTDGTTVAPEKPAENEGISSHEPSSSHGEKLEPGSAGASGGHPAID